MQGPLARDHPSRFEEGLGGFGTFAVMLRQIAQHARQVDVQLNDQPHLASHK